MKSIAIFFDIVSIFFYVSHDERGKSVNRLLKMSHAHKFNGKRRQWMDKTGKNRRHGIRGSYIAMSFLYCSSRKQLPVYPRPGNGLHLASRFRNLLLRNVYYLLAFMLY